MNSLCDVNYDITIVGDFNFPCINWSRDIDFSVLPVIDVECAYFVFDNELVELVKQQTSGENILDFLLVNDPCATYNVAVEATFSTNDHCAIFWQTCFPDVKTEASQLYFDFRCADYAMLTEYLSDVNWLQFFTCVAPYDVEDVW